MLSGVSSVRTMSRTTAGYGEDADALVQRYESITFADVHRAVLHLIPTAPCLILDIGAGTGRDAAALVALGHRVVAVEPTAELRDRAAALHPSPRIEWVDDHLPDLARIATRGDRFDMVMLTAVWMHLDREQRERAMPTVARLLARAGLVTLTLRHGPVPVGRRMFQVSADETVRLAEAEGLRVVVRLENQPDAFGRSDVTWTRLAFSSGDAAELGLPGPFESGPIRISCSSRSTLDATGRVGRAVTLRGRSERRVTIAIGARRVVCVLRHLRGIGSR